MSYSPNFDDRGRTTIRIDGRPFFYEFPQISVEVNSRTVTLEPINEPSVTQHMGVESKKIDIRGSCFQSGANFLDAISDDGEVIPIESERYTGDVIVESVSTDPAGFEYQEERVYNYHLTVREDQRTDR